MRLRLKKIKLPKQRRLNLKGVGARLGLFFRYRLKVPKLRPIKMKIARISGKLKILSSNWRS